MIKLNLLKKKSVLGFYASKGQKHIFKFARRFYQKPFVEVFSQTDLADFIFENSALAIFGQKIQKVPRIMFLYLPGVFSGTADRKFMIF